MTPSLASGMDDSGASTTSGTVVLRQINFCAAHFGLAVMSRDGRRIRYGDAEQTSPGDEHRCVEPAISGSAGFEAHRQSHILVVPLRRPVGFGGRLEGVGLLHQTGVMQQYRLAIIRREGHADIRPPKA